MTRSLYTPAEVAEMTGFHRQVIYRAIRRGELPAFRIRERIRIKSEDLEAWIEREPIEAVATPLRVSPRTRRTNGGRFRLVRDRELEGGAR